MFGLAKAREKTIRDLVNVKSVKNEDGKVLERDVNITLVNFIMEWSVRILGGVKWLIVRGVSTFCHVLIPPKERFRNENNEVGKRSRMVCVPL